MSLFSSKKNHNSSRFIMNSGGALTPEEFGCLSLKAGSKAAFQLISECFFANKKDELTAISKAIRSNRFAADIFAAMLAVAIYVRYAASFLKADTGVVERVKLGVNTGLADLVAPNGQRLDNDFKKFLLQRIHAFLIALDNDEREMKEWPPEAYRANPWPSTQLYINILCQSISNNQDEFEMLDRELTTFSGTLLCHRIEAFKAEIFTMLSEEFKLAS